MADLLLAYFLLHKWVLFLIIPAKKDFEQIWKSSPVLQQAFKEAKQMLVEAVELVHPNPNYPLHLFSDASDHSVGGSLQMQSPDGKYHPLGFYSSHLTPTQKKYSTFTDVSPFLDLKKASELYTYFNNTSV